MKPSPAAAIAASRRPEPVGQRPRERDELPMAGTVAPWTANLRLLNIRHGRAGGGEALATVVDHPPDVAEDDVVERSDLGEAGDGLGCGGHGRGR